MINLKLDKYLNIANEEKFKKGLGDKYAPLYPMLRVNNDNLNIVVALTNLEDNVWDKNESIKPEYWIVIDPKTSGVLEFNKTDEKDFVIGNLIEKHTENKQKEISKYVVNKTLDYKNYIKEDIKSDQLLLVEKNVSESLNNVVKSFGEEININEYIMANISEEIDKKIDELIDLVVQTKYGAITFYYDALFDKIITEYLENNKVDKNKLKLCAEIMNCYYDGVIGIDNLFNA